MMASIRGLLVTFVLLQYGQINGVSAQQYQWNCSKPDVQGERYMPGIGKSFVSSDEGVVPISGDFVSVFRVQNLNYTECFGEVVAIDFCYLSPTEGILSWTVLILDEETSVFTITRIIAIESGPNSLAIDRCTNFQGDGRRFVCCDREYINSFNFQTNNFIFGVTESAQGNLHGASLLGFSEPEFRVDTVESSREGRSIAVGSTLPNSGTVARELPMLAFVIGPTATGTPSPGTTQDPQTNSTLIVIDDHTTDSQETVSEEMVTTDLREPVPPIIIIAVSIVGAVILLLIGTIIILMIIIVFVRKHLRNRDLKETIVTEEVMALDYIKMDTNLSYIPLSSQISTENNIAYGVASVAQDSNSLYEIVDPPIEESTT